MSEPAKNEEKKPQVSWRFYVFAVLNMIVFWSSWPLVSAAFPQFSAGLQFCLVGILPMIFLFVSAPIFLPFGRAEPGATKEDCTREVPAIVKRVVIVAILLSMISWFPSAYIETNALSQPDHAVGQYTVPTNLKGVVRYMTPTQAMIDEVAHWIFWGGAVPVGIFVILRFINKKRRDR
jgi:hypothetical protein